MANKTPSNYLIKLFSVADAKVQAAKKAVDFNKKLNDQTGQKKPLPESTEQKIDDAKFALKLAKDELDNPYVGIQ